jgi:hypothetical protein
VHAAGQEQPALKVKEVTLSEAKDAAVFKPLTEAGAADTSLTALYSSIHACLAHAHGQ